MPGIFSLGSLLVIRGLIRPRPQPEAAVNTARTHATARAAVAGARRVASESVLPRMESRGRPCRLVASVPVQHRRQTGEFCNYWPLRRARRRLFTAETQRR